MQRWVRLPSGAILDANRIMYIGKPDSYNRTDDEGNLMTEFAVTLGTDLDGARQMMVTGTKEEIGALIRSVAGLG
ncbi:MAG: hypothetical protein MUE46_06270 [Xanthomonadales bacterium]|jgi:hypothetical protein|nr:hypothetical protein [Xanthomonadales bacterium]